MVNVKLVTLLVKNVTDLVITNVILAQKVNILMMLVLVFLSVQMELGKMMMKMNVTHVTILVKLVMDQMTTNVTNVMIGPIYKEDIVLLHLVLLVTMLKMLIGLVNHVTPLVVNVLDHLITNVLNVVQLIPIPIYIMDNVLLHAQMVTLPMMVFVKYVMINVALVMVLVLMFVSAVVITYSGGTGLVKKNAHQDIGEMKKLISVKLVMILVILVMVQIQKIVILVSHQNSYTSIMKTQLIKYVLTFVHGVIGKILPDIT